MSNEEYWYWICSIENITPAVITKLLSEFSGPQEIFEASSEELAGRTGLPIETARAVNASKDCDRIKAGLESVYKKGMRFISRESSDFPDRLRLLSDCPPAIYVKGNLPDPNLPAAGMVGARSCSGYGREYAKKYSSALALNKIQVISGMALGIDSVCAKGAMDSGGRTFAVLGCGADVIYPRENIELYYEIITTGGGIISEYPPETAPLAWHFPHRNRVIAALSDTLLVIEAGKRSGTLSTAMHALDLGKDVWALPGRVNDRMSEGCNELISDGAGMLTDIERVIDSLRVEEPLEFDGSSAGENISDGIGPDAQLTSDRQKVYSLIGFEPVETDVIIRDSGLDANTVFEILAELELEDMVVHVSGTFYARK